jgi:hypothetical protein
MREIKPHDQEQPEIIEAWEFMPHLLILYGITLLIVCLA